MASNVLPQAFLLLSPANYSTQFPQLKTQFGVPIDSFRSLSLSNSRVSNLSSFSPVSSKRNLVVRSETESGESGAVVVEELPEEVEVAVSVKQSRVKLGDVMGILNKKAVKAAEEQRAVPDIRTGDVVQIRLEVPENKRRLSVYKGIVISRQNAGIHTTIRVRRIIAGVGVEIVFPLYSPNIKEIKVVTHRKVRKARLYYLRDKLPRLSTFK